MQEGNQKSTSTKDGAAGSKGPAGNLSKGNGSKKNSVGKITFDKSQVLGVGYRETIVFRGEFDGRTVAVKRILSDNFTFAAREAELLRKSDGHPNVIRYYCTEKDKRYHYIALDLCEATLDDWVNGKYVNEKIIGGEVLKQASEGLAHLHSLKIVHRDLKPANILIQAMAGDRIKTVISDFGFSKKIDNDNQSYSLSSTVLGTNGWIAPEVIKNLSGATPKIILTIAVDIFSMGCVFYYVLTYVLLKKGHHPFGEPVHRQSNIAKSDQDLNKLTNRHYNDAVTLIKTMILQEPSMRPPVQAILAHPIFWSMERIIIFCTDISNRISKESSRESGHGFQLLKRFEDRGRVVTGANWTTQISPDVLDELNKPKARVLRPYKGDSVKDLLRALRNSYTHFHDMSKKFQKILGGSPVQCAQYWIDRFPTLLPYTWYSFEALKGEEGFKKYYSSDYDFSTALDYMESEQIKGDDVDPMPKTIVDELCVKRQATSIWKTVEVSKSPLSFTSVCTVRSKEIGNVIAGNFTFSTVQGDGSSEKEAEHYLAMDILSQILEKSPKVIVHELSAKRGITPSWAPEQIAENPAIFRITCTVPNLIGMEISADGDGRTKKEAEKRAALRVLPKIFTSDELLPFTNLSKLCDMIN